MNHGEEMLRLIQEMKDMPEYQTLMKIRHFSISLDIFNGNYRELINHLNIHNDPQNSLELLGIRNKQKLHAFQREIIRLLHNYIASSLSLTDHARNHYKELYFKNNLFPEYQNEINERFTNNTLAVFIKDLRQYMQHYQSPGVSSRLQYKKGEPDFIIKLLLPLEDIKKYSGWHSYSKKFLEEQQDDIDLLDIIEKYHNLIVDFYDWFSSRQAIIHKEDERKVESHRMKTRQFDISNILLDLLINMKSEEEFEENFYQIFSNNEIDIINLTTGEERLATILNILSYIKDLSEDEIKALQNLYSNDH